VLFGELLLGRAAIANVFQVPNPWPFEDFVNDNHALRHVAGICFHVPKQTGSHEPADVALHELGIEFAVLAGVQMLLHKVLAGGVDADDLHVDDQLPGWRGCNSFRRSLRIEG
jgi:hypothetical protein